MCCGWRMSKPSCPSGSAAEPADGADAGRPHLLPLGVDDVPLDVVHRHRVGREQNSALFSQSHSGFLPNGPPWQTPRMPSMMCRTHFLRMIGWLTTCGMNWLHGVLVGAGVRAEDVVDQAVAHVLQGPGHAGGMVVLEAGQDDDLVEPPGDEQAQVRPEAAVVLRVLAAADQLHLHELVGVVAGDRVVAVERDSNLARVPGVRGQAPQRRRRAGSSGSRPCGTPRR